MTKKEDPRVARIEQCFTDEELANAEHELRPCDDCGQAAHSWDAAEWAHTYGAALLAEVRRLQARLALVRDFAKAGTINYGTDYELETGKSLWKLLSHIEGIAGRGVREE